MVLDLCVMKGLFVYDVHRTFIMKFQSTKPKGNTIEAFGMDII